MTDTIAFGSSRQPHYGSGQEESGSGASVNTEKVVPVSKRKPADCPPRLLIPRVSQVVLHLQSWLSWESVPWGLHLRGQSLLQCSPLQTRHVAEGNLDAWDAPWDVPPPTVITSPSLHLGPSGHFFSGYFRMDLTAMLGLQSFPGLFCLWFSSLYCLPYYTIWATCNRLSKDWFGPYICFCNLWQISGANWVSYLFFKVISPLNFGNQHQ